MAQTNRLAVGLIAIALGGATGTLLPISAKAQPQGWHPQSGPQQGWNNQQGPQQNWNNQQGPQQNWNAQQAGRGWGDANASRYRGGSAGDAFAQGYRQGRDDERRSRRAAMRGRLHPDSFAGSDQGNSQGYQDQGQQGQRKQGSETLLVIPHVYPANAPFQQFAVVPDYAPSMRWLLASAQGLREAIQAMAQQPANPARDHAIAQARRAILETQEAMVLLPPDERTR